MAAQTVANFEDLEPVSAQTTEFEDLEPVAPKYTGMEAGIPATPKPKLPPELENPEQAAARRRAANTPTYVNYRTGKQYFGDNAAPGPFSVLDAPVEGAQQIAQGVEHMAQPGMLAKAGGAATVIGGALKATEPLMAGAGIAAPIESAIALGVGSLSQSGTEALLKKLDVPEEYAALGSTLAGLAGAAGGVKLTGIPGMVRNAVFRARIRSILQDRLNRDFAARSASERTAREEAAKPKQIGGEVPEPAVKPAEPVTEAEFEDLEPIKAAAPPTESTPAAFEDLEPVPAYELPTGTVQATRTEGPHTFYTKTLPDGTRVPEKRILTTAFERMVEGAVPGKSASGITVAPAEQAPASSSKEVIQPKPEVAPEKAGADLSKFSDAQLVKGRDITGEAFETEAHQDAIDELQKRHPGVNFRRVVFKGDGWYVLPGSRGAKEGGPYPEEGAAIQALMQEKAGKPTGQVIEAKPAAEEDQYIRDEFGNPLMKKGTEAPEEKIPERTVQEDVDRSKTLKKDVAATLAKGSTRKNPDGTVEELREVDLAKIRPAEPTEERPQGNVIYPDVVQRYVDNPSPVAPELRPGANGDFLTWEGHHRIEAAKQRGDSKILAWVPKEQGAEKPQSSQPVRVGSGGSEVLPLSQGVDGGVSKPAGSEEPGVSGVQQANRDQAGVQKGIEAAPKHKLSSTQVNLPEEYASKARAFAATIPDDVLAEDGREDESHITALYGLEHTDPEPVKKILEGQGPITARVKTTSVFPATKDHPYDVVKLDVESPQLTELNKKLRALPNSNKFPDYRPHLTLAYVKAGEGKKYAGRVIPGLSGKEITFDALHFSPAEGAKTEIPLKAKEKGVTPDRRRIIMRGMHDRVHVEFADRLDAFAFDAAGKSSLSRTTGQNPRGQQFESLVQESKRLASKHGIDENKARRIILEYHEYVKGLSKEQDPHSETPLKIIPRSLADFAKERIPAKAPEKSVNGISPQQTKSEKLSPDGKTVAQLKEHLAQTGYDKPYGQLTEGQRESIDLRAARRMAPLPTPEKKPVTPQIVPVKKVVEVKPAGASAEVYTTAGRKVNISYNVREASALTNSFQSGYPQEYQPRDTARKGSRVRVDQRKADMSGPLMADSRLASDGAPITLADGTVITRNHGTQALKELYSQKNPLAGKYKSWLSEHAEEFGLYRAKVEAMKAPLLERVITDKMSPEEIKEFAEEANASSTARMSDSEVASALAERMAGPLMDSFDPTEDGRPNPEFVRELIKTLPVEEQAVFMDKEGKLSQAGARIIRQVIFAKAYPDERALERMAESESPTLKNLTAGMLSAAPRVAKLSEEVSRGNRFDLGIGPEIADAAAVIDELVRTGTTLEVWMNQGDMFGRDPVVEKLVQVLSENRRSSKRIGDFLKEYTDVADAAGSPKQESMFGPPEAPEKIDVAEAAYQRAKDRWQPQRDIFEAQGTKPEGSGLAPEKGEGEGPPERPAQFSRELEPPQESLFADNEESASAKEAQRYEDRLLGQRLTAQIKSGLAKGPSKLKPVKNKSLFEEEGPEQDALFSRIVPGFYSQLERTVVSKMPNKAPAAQVLNIVRSPQNGVKEDEIKWSGLDDFLKEKGGQPVTKQEVLEFVRANETKITEVEKGAARLSAKKIGSHRPHGYDIGQWEVTDEKTGDTLKVDAANEEEAIRRAHSRVEQAGSRLLDTKYGQYVTPGGSNYRELLLTLPVDQNVAQAAKSARVKDLIARRDDIQAQLDAYPAVERSPDSRVEQLRREKAYAEKDELKRQLENTTRQIDMVMRQNPEKQAGYRSSHWEEPNVLAHIRIDDRTGQGGEKILHVSEIQSDWHQEGKRKGYREDFEKSLTPEEKELRDLNAKTWESGVNATLSPEDSRRKFALQKKVGASLSEKSIRSRTGVSQAPFTKTWQELAFRRVLRYAAEGGYDAVTWDTGDVQNDRYDLSKQVDSVHYSPEEKRLWAVKDGSNVIDKSNVEPSELPDYIGKDVAQKLVDAPVDKGTYDRRSLSGDGLKIGGDGMKGFYDKILPDFANRYGKKWGSKVGTQQMSAGKGTQVAEYTGPNYTPEEFSDWLAERRQRWNNGTGEGWRSWNVTNDQHADMVLKSLKSGMSFKQAMEKDAGTILAELVGGKMEWSAPDVSVKVHAMPITPEMRESVMQGQPLFMRGQESEATGPIRTAYRNGILWVNSAGMKQLAQVFGSDAANGMYIPSGKASGLLSKVPPELRPGITAALKAGPSITVVRMNPGESISQSKAKARHELFHATETWGGKERAKTLLENPLAERASALLAGGGYDAGNPELMFSEIGAHLASGPVGWEAMGLEREEARELFRQYARLLDDRTVEDLDRLSPLLKKELNAERAIRREQAELGQSEGAEDQNLEGGAEQERPGVRSSVRSDVPGEGTRPTGKVKESKLAKGVEEKAIRNGLTEGFAGRPEYQTVNIAEQARMAADLIKADPEHAIEIAMGRELPPNGLLPESVFVAVENYATENKDVNLLRDLATSSTLSMEATGMGQRIRMLGERNPNSAVHAMQEVADAREAAVKKKYGPKAKEKIKAEIKVSIKKASPKKHDWANFISSITCD